MTEEDNQKNNEDTDTNIVTKTDNNPVYTQNGIEQKKTETAFVINPTSSEAAQPARIGKYNLLELKKLLVKNRNLYLLKSLVMEPR